MRALEPPCAGLLAGPPAIRLPGPAVAQSDDLDGFDTWIELAREAWSMPGLGVAIVDGDEVVFARGFGVRELGGDAAVDTDTLFAIGSNSTQFTAAAMGALVDEFTRVPE